MLQHIGGGGQILNTQTWTQKLTYFHVKHEEVTALSNGQGLTREPRPVMSFTRRANTLQVSKHAQPNLQTLHCTYTYEPCALTLRIHPRMPPSLLDI